MTIPASMRVALVHDFNDIRTTTQAVPACGDDDLLVRIAACGVCSGDVMDWYIRAKAPLVLGHEPSGTVVAVGRNVTAFSPGDRVFLHHHAPCFLCDACHRGDHVHCPTWKKSRLDPGGMAEYVRVPRENQADTLILPEKVSLEDATLIEPAACAVKGVRRSGLQPGETLVITGMGVMGMLNLLVARAWGAGRIIVADLHPWRLARALEFGADVALDLRDAPLAEQVRRHNGGQLAPRVIVGPGSVAAMRDGLSACAPGGTVLFFTPTPPGVTLELEPHYLYFNEIDLRSSYSCGPYDTRTALDLIAGGVIRAEQLVTHRFPLAEAAAAFRLTAQAGESLKALVRLTEEA